MAKTLFVVNDPPYGSQRSDNEATCRDCAR